MVLSKMTNKNILLILASSFLIGILVAFHQYLIYGLILLMLFFLVIVRISLNHIYNLMILLLPLMVYVNLGLTFNFSFSDILLPISFFVSLSVLVKNEDLFFQKYKLLLFYMYVLIFALVLSFIKPMFFHIDGFELGTAISNIMKIIINFAYTFTFLIYFMNNGKTTETSYTFLKVWNIMSVVFSFLCITGVVLFYFGIKTTLTSDFRATGTFEDPNLAAAFLIISIGFCLAFNTKCKTVGKRIPFNLFIILFALLLTSSRGGVLGLGLGFALVILFNITNKGIKQILKIVLFCVFIILTILVINFVYPLEFVNASLNRISSVGNDESGTNLRLLLWETAFLLWKDNPLLGVGFGQYLPNAHLINSSIVNIPHNTYLSFLAETGIIGFISFFCLPLYLFYKLYKLIKTGDMISIYLFVSFSGIMVQAFTINLENFRCLWVFFAFILYWVHKGHLLKDS